MNLLEKDIKITIENRGKVFKNKNLLYWYKKSYEFLFKGIDNIEHLTILEVGSGTSPIKYFYPSIKTSDIMPLNFIDYKFDAMNIDNCKELEGKTFDIITFSNVLHHVNRPLEFLLKCEKRLNANGKIIFLEPYFSVMSGIIYKYIHYEYSNIAISKPEIENIEGPLSTSNIALPYLIFFTKKEWRSKVADKYEMGRTSYFTSLSYFFAGGISGKFSIPHFIYRVIFKIDSFFTKLFPGLFGTFFILQLRKKQK